jgi:hypothetical protein
MDLESHRRWYDYSRARDAMFAATDTKVSPWYVVNADDKRRARLNCIAHLLSLIPYKKISREKNRAATQAEIQWVQGAGLQLQIRSEDVLIGSLGAYFQQNKWRGDHLDFSGRALSQNLNHQG